jgi:hypothetical protein
MKQRVRSHARMHNTVTVTVTVAITAVHCTAQTTNNNYDTRTGFPSSHLYIYTVHTIQSEHADNVLYEAVCPFPHQYLSIYTPIIPIFGNIMLPFPSISGFVCCVLKLGLLASGLFLGWRRQSLRVRLSAERHTH